MQSSDYLTSLFGLSGKVAVVIGGGGFLCSAMTEGLARAGCSVVVLDKQEEKARGVSERIEAAGGRAFSMAIDATRKEDHESALARTISIYGQVDVLINGAGINAPTPFLDITLDELHSIFDSHVSATLLGCQVFGKHMISRKSGSIINISSASAGPPLSKAFSYSVAKAGIRNLTQNLAREWATQGVRVNALRPGFFPTEWSKKHFITPERSAAILGHTPMGRFGEPEELVGAVLWLASEAARFVTGAHISVDGGFSAMTI